MATIAFIGLGQMGPPIASNLLQQGHQLRVSGADAEAARHLVDKGATPVANPVWVAKDAESIIIMLPNGDLIRNVLFGENGACEGLFTDALVIDMFTTHSLQTDKLIADMQAKGLSMMDVPVGRTSANAITGTLLLPAGDTAEQAKRATPILMAMNSELISSGGPGMGIHVKLVNNYVSIALSMLSAEAAILYGTLNLPFDVAIKVMSGTTVGKGHFTVPWPNKVLNGDLFPAFTTDLAHKGLDIALDAANQLHMPMPLRATSWKVRSQAHAVGRGRQDQFAILGQVRTSARMIAKVKM